MLGQKGELITACAQPNNCDSAKCLVNFNYLYIRRGTALFHMTTSQWAQRQCCVNVMPQVRSSSTQEQTIIYRVSFHFMRAVISITILSPHRHKWVGEVIFAKPVLSSLSRNRAISASNQQLGVLLLIFTLLITANASANVSCVFVL